MKEVLDAILRLLQDDGHQWSRRPCQTCRAISSLAGYSFGCIKKAEEP